MTKIYLETSNWDIVLLGVDKFYKVKMQKSIQRQMVLFFIQWQFINWAKWYHAWDCQEA